MGIIILLLVVVIIVIAERVVYERLWDEHLKAELSFEKARLREGDETVLVETLEYAGRLPLPWLHVKFQASRDITFLDSAHSCVTDYYYREDVFTIASGERITRRLPVVCPRRGVQRVRSVDLLSMDMLLTKKLICNCCGSEQVIVYPKLVDVSALVPQAKRFTGKYITRRNILEDPFVFKGIREYVEGDAMQRVNWRTSARTDQLAVNTFESTTAFCVTIWLNLDSGLDWCDIQLAEESIRIAASITHEYVSQGIPVSLVSNGRDYISLQETVVSGGSSPQHIDTVCTALARIDLDAPMRPIQDMLRDASPAMDSEEYVFIISTYAPKQLVAVTKKIGENGSYMPQWVIPLRSDDAEGRKLLDNLDNCFVWEVERDA